MSKCMRISLPVLILALSMISCNSDSSSHNDNPSNIDESTGEGSNNTIDITGKWSMIDPDTQEILFDDYVIEFFSDGSISEGTSNPDDGGKGTYVQDGNKLTITEIDNWKKTDLKIEGTIVDKNTINLKVIYAEDPSVLGPLGYEYTIKRL